MTPAHGFEKLMWFSIFFSHFFLWFYHSTLFFKNDFVDIFNFFSIDLFESHDLCYGFRMYFLIKGFFFKKKLFVFNFWLIFTLFYIDEIYFIKKNLF